MGAYSRLALVQGWLLFKVSACSRLALIQGWCSFKVGAYSRLALVRGWRLFKVGACSRLALIQGWRLFKVGACSRLGAYLDNYGDVLNLFSVECPVVLAQYHKVFINIAYFSTVKKRHHEIESNYQKVCSMVNLIRFFL